MSVLLLMRSCCEITKVPEVTDYLEFLARAR
jgi:hypothetical protein